MIASDNLVCHDSTSLSIQTLVLAGGEDFVPTLLTVSNITTSQIILVAVIM